MKAVFLFLLLGFLKLVHTQRKRLSHYLCGLPCQVCNVHLKHEFYFSEEIESTILLVAWRKWHFLFNKWDELCKRRCQYLLFSLWAQTCWVFTFQHSCLRLSCHRTVTSVLFKVFLVTEPQWEHQLWEQLYYSAGLYFEQLFDPPELALKLTCRSQ